MPHPLSPPSATRAFFAPAAPAPLPGLPAPSRRTDGQQIPSPGPSSFSPPPPPPANVLSGTPLLPFPSLPDPFAPLASCLTLHHHHLNAVVDLLYLILNSSGAQRECDHPFPRELPYLVNLCVDAICAAAGGVTAPATLAAALTLPPFTHAHLHRARPLYLEHPDPYIIPTRRIHHHFTTWLSSRACCKPGPLRPTYPRRSPPSG